MDIAENLPSEEFNELGPVTAMTGAKLPQALGSDELAGDAETIPDQEKLNAVDAHDNGETINKRDDKSDEETGEENFTDSQLLHYLKSSESLNEDEHPDNKEARDVAGHRLDAGATAEQRRLMAGTDSEDQPNRKRRSTQSLKTVESANMNARAKADDSARRSRDGKKGGKGEARAIDDVIKNLENARRAGFS